MMSGSSLKVSYIRFVKIVFEWRLEWICDLQRRI
jgi:hypothetical protein